MRVNFSFAILTVSIVAISCIPEEIVYRSTDDTLKADFVVGSLSLAPESEDNLWQNSEDSEDELISLAKVVIAKALRNYTWSEDDVLEVRRLAALADAKCADLLDVIQVVPNLEIEINNAINGSTELGSLVLIDLQEPLISLNSYLSRSGIQYFLGIVVPNNEVVTGLSSTPYISAGLEANAELNEAVEENILVSENSVEYYYMDETLAMEVVTDPLFVVGIDTELDRDYSDLGIDLIGESVVIDPYSVTPPFDGTSSYKLNSGRITHHVDQFKPHNRFERRSNSEVKIKWSWKASNTGVSNDAHNWTEWNKQRSIHRNDINNYIGWTYLFDRNNYTSDENTVYNAYERDWWGTYWRIGVLSKVGETVTTTYQYRDLNGNLVTVKETKIVPYRLQGSRSYFNDVYFFDAHFNDAYPIISNHPNQWSTRVFTLNGAEHRIWRINM